MKMVAAAKLKKAQKNIITARPYAYAIKGVLGHLIPRIDRNLHPLLHIREPKKVCMVVITADRGLCGSFNSNIIRKAAQIMDQYDPESLSLICIGRKGKNYFSRRGYNILSSYVDFFRYLEFAHATRIIKLISNLYIEKGLDRVDLIYNEFKSAVRQDVIVEPMLPLVPPPQEDYPEFRDYIFEPSIKEIVDSLVPLHLNVQMWRILLESNAAEQGARMTAMENATENAKEIISHLRLTFNKARQAAITKDMLEIVGPTEVMRKAAE